MIAGLVSERGQLTIPAEARRKLGIRPRSRVEIFVRDDDIIVRPLKTVRELRGIFRRYAEGKSSDWDTVREDTMQRVAREVARE
jgi:AbrB family looped-hinge helix DNA binding protein